MKNLSFLVLSLFFVGCTSSTQWVQDERPDSEIKTQFATCELEMERSAPSNVSGEERAGLVHKLTVLCMKAKGYREVPTE